MGQSKKARRRGGARSIGLGLREDPLAITTILSPEIRAEEEVLAVDTQLPIGRVRAVESPVIELLV
jgi:hypothetical protein